MKRESLILFHVLVLYWTPSVGLSKLHLDCRVAREDPNVPGGYAFILFFLFCLLFFSFLAEQLLPALTPLYKYAQQIFEILQDSEGEGTLFRY